MTGKIQYESQDGAENQVINITPSEGTENVPEPQSNITSSSQKAVAILAPGGRRFLLKTNPAVAENVSEKVSRDNSCTKLIVNSEVMDVDQSVTSDVVTPNVTYSNEVEVLSSSDKSTPLGLKKDFGLPKTINTKDLQLMLEKGLQNDTDEDIQVEIGPDNDIIIQIKEDEPQTRQKTNKRSKEKERIYTQNRIRKKKARYGIEGGISSAEYLEQLRCPDDRDSILTPSGHKWPFPVKLMTGRPGERGPRGMYQCPVDKCPFEFETGLARFFVENHLERHVTSFICQTRGTYTFKSM